MRFKFDLYIPHIIAVFGLLVLSFIYCKPVLEGKVLTQQDMIQATGAAEEITKFKAETGEDSWWTNSMFGGMPAYTIKGDFPKSLTTKACRFLTYIFPAPVNMVFWLLLGFYIMMAALGFNPWISAASAIAYAFCSYNIIIIQAGHVSKVLAVAYAPPVIGGLILLYKGKYFRGAFVFLFFTLMELYANHIQITYYLGISILFLVLYELYAAVKEKTIPVFVKASLIAGALGILSIGSMVSRFWTTTEYAKYSTRGPSELKAKQGENSEGGLDKDYAYSWSYGIMETFTYLIPNFNGGGSSGSLSDGSNVYKVLIDNNVPKQDAKQFAQNIGGYGGSLYWGGQPSTSGPSYYGSIICFLFVLSLFIVKDKLKWWALGVAFLFTIMAWGKNIPWFTDLMFNNFPMYNKFRAVTMIHSLVALLIVFMAGYAIKAFIDRRNEEKVLEKYLKYSLGIIGGILVFFFVFGTTLFEFEKPSEEIPGQKAVSADDYFKSVLNQVTQSPKLSDELVDALKEDRISLFRSDIIRSLIFVLLAAALMWALLKRKIEDLRIIYAGLLLLILTDLWSVSKRYLNDQDFIPAKRSKVSFEPSPADLQILADNDPDFRVYNSTVSTFNDAVTSYFHKSIGGYSGAKMKRYQELIENQIAKNNMSVLNMLNTKYIIVKAENGVMAQRNPEACGHAWVVDQIQWVDNADAEMSALDKFEPLKTAVIDKKFKSSLGEIIIDSSAVANIDLLSYKPNNLKYSFNSTSAQLVVFSEIYYNNGAGWESFIDGKPVPHVRANYVLRAMKVPAGKHSIEFNFHPRSFYVGSNIDLVFSILIIPVFLMCGFFMIKEDNKA